MSWEKPQKENICAAIVTYHPDPGFPDRAARIISQVCDVVIVDNHSAPPAVNLLRDVSSRLGAHLILNTENLGVAAALNQGCRWAQNRGCKWVMTLDQDSIAGADLVRTLAEVGDHFQEQDRIAMIGSSYFNMATRNPRVLEPDSFTWREEDSIITSGSLVSLTAFETIGPFREEFFIDLVDTEYCLRARSKGYRVILSLKPTMCHSIGAPSAHTILGKNTGTSNQPAFRFYYMIRNHVVLAREYLLKEPGFVTRTLYSKIKTVVLMSLFERDRLGKLKCAALGLKDGLMRKFDRRRG